MIEIRLFCFDSIDKQIVCFFSPKLGKSQTAFGEKGANLSLEFEVLIVGEIEQQIFCAMATF